MKKDMKMEETMRKMHICEKCLWCIEDGDYFYEADVDYFYEEED